MSNLVIEESAINVVSLNSYPEQINNYFSNSPDDKNKKETENQNHIMSNSVEKVIINPDTLSQYKPNDINSNLQFSTDVINQLEELTQSLLVEDLDNSLVNNIEESEEKGHDIKQQSAIFYPNINTKKNKNNDLDYLLNYNKEYLSPVYPKKKIVDNNNNSLLKKIVNGLFFDNNKKSKSVKTNTTKDLLSQNIKSKSVSGLSTFYSLSTNSIKINNQNNLINGIKSPITPSISSPVIENAVFSIPITKQQNQPFHFLPTSFKSIFSQKSKFNEKNSSLPLSKSDNHSDHESSELTHFIPNQSIKNLKEIKSIMDSKSHSSSKDNSKNIKNKSIINSNQEIKRSASSLSSSSSSSSSSKWSKEKRTSKSKIDLQSFINVYNNLSDAYANNNMNENSNGILPPYSSTLSSNESFTNDNKGSLSNINSGQSFPSYITSLPLLSNGESFVVLPPLRSNSINKNNIHFNDDVDNKPTKSKYNEEQKHENDKTNNNNNNNNNNKISTLSPSSVLSIQDKNEDEISVSSSYGSEYNPKKMLLSSKAIPMKNKRINCNVDTSFSQSFPKRNSYVNNNCHHHHNNNNDTQNSHTNIHYSYSNKDEYILSDSFSLSSKLENSKIHTIHEESENNDNNVDASLCHSRIKFKIQSQLSPNNNKNKKNNNLNQNNDHIRRRKTIYTATSYFNKSTNNNINSNNTNLFINRNNNNNNDNRRTNKRRSRASDADGLCHSHSLHNSNRSNNSYGGVISRHYSISTPRSAFTNFLSNFSFTSTNSNTSTSSEQDEEDDYDNEFVDHSFIKSSASIFSSYINAEAEKKSSIDSKTPSVFDPNFIEKVRRKSMYINAKSYEKEEYIEPSSFNSIIIEPEKLRLLNPIYARAQYLESLHSKEEKDRMNSRSLSGLNLNVVSPDQILDTVTAEKLRFHLPRRYRDYSSWELIFSLNDHGSSFLTLYDKIVGKGPLFLVIKDTNDQIFGAFIPENVKVSSRYYGSGECFLWKKGNSQDQRSFKVFEWSGLNEHNVLTTRNTIAFGGGRQGHFGLSLDHNLEGGTTARCDTFKNEPLTLSSKMEPFKPQTLPTYYETSDISFECINLEFWKIVNDHNLHK